MEGTALVLMLFELIGLKIIFDVALRDVGTTPSWAVDVLCSPLTVVPALGGRDWIWGLLGLFCVCFWVLF